MQTYAYGFPRLGKDKEYKKLIENYWNGEIPEEQLRVGIDKLEASRLAAYEEQISEFPAGEMTLYDNMLDTALMVGLYECKDLKGYFDLCRGRNALELTKWFNTNYHYLVPDFGYSAPVFKVAWNKPKQELDKHGKGIPYLIGPFTFLKLSKGIEPGKFGDYLLALGEVYAELIKDFSDVHIDEPAFVMDISEEEIGLIKEVYGKMGSGGSGIYLFTYYDSVDFLEELYELPVKAIGLDFINGEENLERVQKCGFPKGKALIAGIVNGRNVWRAEIKEVVETLRELSSYAEKLMISNASPLYHLPITIEDETLPEQLVSKLAFAKERLYELNMIASAYEGDIEGHREWNKDTTFFGANEQVRKRVRDLKDEAFLKSTPYRERIKQQKEILDLPLFPTSTIGSFPQTPEIRKKRADSRSGRISEAEYSSFIKGEISKLIELQEGLGLDVLVHGEFERTDMVEFFAERLNGIATTRRGWVLSYGTRAYRPPIIYGDISRTAPMTVDEIAFAQSLTQKPVKGMLTGPITIIAWSFTRGDVPISEVAYQIALCLQDEIKDYEKQGIKIVQIDEPAFRERAPIKKRKWDEYFEWATKSFRLTSQSKPETQIQTHMCYSEFAEIIEYIIQMDFDVITIEASRSKGDIINCFETVNFDRQIGLGVWDIHSPAVPSVPEMKRITERALDVLPRESFWINPDCGLKTREWKEVLPSLKNLVQLAQELRKEAGLTQ